MHDAKRFEAFATVGDAFRTTVSHMIARHRDGIETRPGQCSKMRWICARRRHITRHFVAPSGVRHFQMTDGDIRCLQGGRDACEPMVRLGHVEHEVSGQHDRQDIL